MPSTEVIENLLPPNDVSRHTAAFKIHHYRFIVRIAQFHLYSQEQLSHTWRVTSGNAEVDRALAEQQVAAQLTIAEMAEHHANGATMTLETPEDSMKIYDIIHQHLMDWMRALETHAVPPNAPLEDLRKLDALASDIYQIARYYWRKTAYHGKLTSFLDKLSQTAGGRVKRHRQTPSTASENTTPTGQHTPMSDAIAKIATARGRTWS